MSSTLKAAVCAAAAFTIGAQAALAQASGDGRQGPFVFSGAALDESLLAMNDFLRARYVSDDIVAGLHEPPAERDFVTVAIAVSGVPALESIRVAPGFGPAVMDGQSLDLQLASFNTDMERRGDPLFVRVARAAGGTALDFAEVAGIPPVPGGGIAFGPEIWSGETLDEHMLALYDHMIEQDARNSLLSVAAEPADTGSSFDRYGDSLRLY
jgi:hypothetical protein